MKTICIILSVLLVVGFHVNASPIPENLTAITLENIEDLQPIVVYERDNSAAIYDFVWLEDEETSTIVFGGISGFFYLDLTTDELSQRQLGTYTVYSISMNPVSQVIAVADARMVHLIDPETGDELRVLEHDALVVEFSRDGNLLATGDGAGSIKIWDTEDYQLLYTLQAEFDNAVSDLEFNDTGTVLASGHQRLGVHLWNLSENPPQLRLLDGNASRTIAFTPSFNSIAVGYHSNIDAPTISIWNIESDDETIISGHKEQTTTLDFNEDATLLVSGGDDSIRLWDYETGDQLSVLNLHDDWISAVKFSHAQTMIASTSRDGSLVIWGIVKEED